jgi:hypothetical protein
MSRLKQLLKAFQEFAHGEGFYQVVAGTLTHQPSSLIGIAVARDEDEGRRPIKARDSRKTSSPERSGKPMSHMTASGDTAGTPIKASPPVRHQKTVAPSSSNR